MSPELINGIFAISGALIGAIVGGVFSRNIAKKNKEKKEISLYSTHSTQLLEVSDIVKKKAEILIDGNPVDGIYKNEFIILNSGNATLYDLNFKLKLLDEDSQLLGLEFNRSNFKIKETDYTIDLNNNKSELTLSFINPNDELNFILLTDSKTELDINFRQPEINSIIKTKYSPEIPGVLVQSLFDAFESNLLLKSLFMLSTPDFRKYLKHKNERNTTHNNV